MRVVGAISLYCCSKTTLRTTNSYAFAESLHILYSTHLTLTRLFLVHIPLIHHFRIRIMLLHQCSHSPLQCSITTPEPQTGQITCIRGFEDVDESFLSGRSNWLLLKKGNSRLKTTFDSYRIPFDFRRALALLVRRVRILHIKGAV